jgi:hypothetical protein
VTAVSVRASRDLKRPTPRVLVSPSVTARRIVECWFGAEAAPPRLAPALRLVGFVDRDLAGHVAVRPEEHTHPSPSRGSASTHTPANPAGSDAKKKKYRLAADVVHNPENKLDRLDTALFVPLAAARLVSALRSTSKS